MTTDHSKKTEMRRRPPPLAASRATSPADAQAKKLAREQKDAQVRGVTSIDAMREAIRRAGPALAPITEVARIVAPDAAQFRVRAAQGLPFLITGVVGKWPLGALTPQVLRERYSEDLVEHWTEALPPYLGNLELRELNSLCHWPAYFRKMGPARFWLGPAGTVTPLHCDYDDNIFAQVWGSKRIFLAPPHHDVFLYPREANAILFGSPFDPEAPDFERFPLARQATLIECIVHPGDMLYVPAGWYHQVRALTFSLSANRWARALPLALDGDTALLRTAD
jgi:hypothetical protein